MIIYKRITVIKSDYLNWEKKCLEDKFHFKIFVSFYISGREEGNKNENNQEPFQMLFVSTGKRKLVGQQKHFTLSLFLIFE